MYIGSIRPDICLEKFHKVFCFLRNKNIYESSVLNQVQRNNPKTEKNRVYTGILCLSFL